MSLGKIGKLTNVFNAFKQSPFSNKSDMISSLAAFGNINKAASYLNKVNSDGAISNTASKMLLYKAYAASGITKEEAGEALNNNLAGSSKFGLLGNIKNVGSGIATVFKSIAPMMIPLIIGAVGIKAGKMLWDNVLTDNAAQKNLQESVQKYKTEKSDLDNLQSQKETNKQRVYELRAKSNRTAAEDNELNNLLNEDSILDTQIGLKKRTVTSAQKQQALDAKKALEKRTFQGELFGKSPYPVYQDTNIGYAQKLMNGLEDEKQARKDVFNNKEWSSERKEAELKAKSPTSHTHNYAGSSSSGGAANSANKLATARTVSGGTDITLSFNYDGSGNSSANIGFYSSSASVGDKNNYPFHRFAKLDTIAASYSDKSTTFFISQDYSGGGFGIVRIVLRTNNSSLASTVEVKWLVRCGLSADSVQVGIYNVFGKTYADAFFKTGGSYAGTCFRTLASGARGGISRTWMLVNSSEVSGTSATDAKTSTECYATIAAAGTALHKQAYSSIVSGTDSGTASYANSAGSANSVAWGNVTGKPSTFAPSSHTHNYAGSSSAGGAATSAIKLSTPRKIGNASFDGTADITLSQMGLNVPVEITKANYLAKKKAGTLNANTYYNVIDEYDSANVINDSSVTANSAFSSTKSEKTYAKKSTLVNTTLTASKWTGSSAPYSYVLSVSGVTSSNIVEIDYASNASSAAIEAYQNAMLADGGQTTNQITIKATEKPTVDIPITIVIRNDL